MVELLRWAPAVALAALFLSPLNAQQDTDGGFESSGIPALPLPGEPMVFDTGEGLQIRVSVVADGLSHPWSLALLPNGGMLVTERSGSLRLIRHGVLDITPIAGVPEVFTGGGLSGLMDVVLHPQFSVNRFVYLSYSKPTDQGATVAVARGRFDGHELSNVTDIFVAKDDIPVAASRLVFAIDGTLFMTLGGAVGGARDSAQNPRSHIGKVLRLHDDGTVPDDNPFVGEAGYLPEIYSLGHRNQLGIAIHPETGAVWASENAPMGGDEVNVILPGRNYGWPLVSHAREYYGPRVTKTPWREGLEQPEVVWVPSIAPSGLLFYTGNRFPAWNGDLFVGSLMRGRIARTGHVERISFNRQGMEQRREWLLANLRQRVRDVRQGPDDLIYVVTDGAEMFGETATDGAVLRIEPVE